MAWAAIAAEFLSAASSYYEQRKEADWRAQVDSKLDQILANTVKILQEIQELRIYIKTALTQHDIENTQARLRGYKNILDDYRGKARRPSEVNSLLRPKFAGLRLLIQDELEFLTTKGGCAFWPSIAGGVAMSLFCMKVERWPKDNVLSFIRRQLGFFEECLDPNFPESFRFRLSDANRVLKENPLFLREFKREAPQGFIVTGFPRDRASSPHFYQCHYAGNVDSGIRLSSKGSVPRSALSQFPQLDGKKLPGCSPIENVSFSDALLHGYNISGLVNEKIENLHWAEKNRNELTEAVEGLDAISARLRTVKRRLEKQADKELTPALLKLSGRLRSAYEVPMLRKQMT